MVQQVEVVVGRGQHEFVACAFFLAPFVFALGFGGIYFAQGGAHPAIVIVVAIASFVLFLFALARLPILAWIYGAAASIGTAIYAYIFIYNFSDAIWASLAAAGALAFGLICTWVASGVFSGNSIFKDDDS